jgi:hypothetical protein
MPVSGTGRSATATVAPASDPDRASSRAAMALRSADRFPGAHRIPRSPASTLMPALS